MNQSNIGNMGNAGSMGGISLSGSGTALEMKVVKPQQFDSVTQIADHLLNKRTVVLNLESTSKETARRLIDFLSGVAYSIDGSIKKIASNAYVITPSN
ncbi:MAG: cell division protein SepF, partial [Clostridia bacterium]|nr:cell division protein SepF [Clostridia bacterium]